MSHPISSLAELNGRHAEFWRETAKTIETLMSKELIRIFAFEELAYQEASGVPVNSRRTVEGALLRYDDIAKRVISAHAAKGGKAKRTTPLDAFIEAFLREMPMGSAKDLLKFLAVRIGEAGGFRVENGFIYFLDDGKERRVSERGLKDRLSRARRKRIARTG
jgi:hypothetical protein